MLEAEENQILKQIADIIRPYVATILENKEFETAETYEMKKSLGELIDNLKKWKKLLGFGNWDLKYMFDSTAHQFKKIKRFSSDEKYTEKETKELAILFNEYETIFKQVESQNKLDRNTDNETLLFLFLRDILPKILEIIRDNDDLDIINIRSLLENMLTFVKAGARFNYDVYSPYQK
jgi:hypothetical protein